MPLISLLFVLVVIGVVVWAITSFIPMEPKIKNLIVIVAVIAAVFYCLSAFGIMGSMSGVRVPTVH